MRDLTDAAVRLGLALHRKTILSGPGFYSIYDLIFEPDEQSASRSAFLRAFSTRENFWGVQQEAARVLDGAGIAKVQRRQVKGSGVGDYWLQITPLGKSIYALAYLQSDSSAVSIEGLSIEDLAKFLSDDNCSQDLGSELRAIDSQLQELGLSNYQIATVSAYVTVLVTICGMPERDAKLFWLVLDRLNQFAGVASLIVALIALKMSS